MLAVSRSGSPSWKARLELRFERRGERTVLHTARNCGPLRVQRAFYPPGDVACHVYLLHPPGGVVVGDRLDIDIEVAAGARALVTTPSACKLYRGDGEPAVQRVRCRVDAGGELEWLPAETIAFAGTRAETSLEVDLDAGARFLGWEIIALGRPAAGERFDRGALRSSIELAVDRVPRVIDRLRVGGGDDILDAAWGLAGHTTTATLVAAGAALDLAPLRAAVAGDHAALTAVEDDTAVARWLGDHALEARDALESIRAAARPQLLGRPAVRPRIWHT